MASPNASELATTTLINRTGKIRDNVTKNIVLLNRLAEKGQSRPVDGGRAIYEEISYQESSNFQWYSGADPLSTGATDLLTSAEYGWKQCAATLVVTGAEEMQNSGKERKIGLVESKLKVVEATLKNNMEVALASDGTGSGGKQLVGLDSLVAATQTSGVYGLIDRNLWPFWRAFTATAQLSATNINAKATTAMISCTRGNDSPDLIIAGATAYGFFQAAAQPLQFFQNPKLAEVGFQTFRFQGADVVCGGGIGGAFTATDLYILNTNYVYFRPHIDRNFVPLRPRDSVNQDASINIMAFMGNLTSSGPQFCGRHVGA